MTKPRIIYHEDCEWVKKSEYDKLRRKLNSLNKIYKIISNGEDVILEGLNSRVPLKGWKK